MLSPRGGAGLKMEWCGREDSPAGEKLGPAVANFCQTPMCHQMSTMNVSMPDTLRTFVDEQVAGRGYGSSSEYIRELIRRDQDRQHLRSLLLEGASSPPGAPLDATYFNELRERARAGR